MKYNIEKEMIFLMPTPYQNIAKAALMNWNGLTEEEAQKRIESESVRELESQVYALSSVTHAVSGIANEIELTEEEQSEFLEAVIYGPETSPIFETVSKKAEGLTDEGKLNILSTIHDDWVQDNSNEATFQKKVSREQLRQYAPLELIGWNEVKSDLLFLSPILSSIGVEVNEATLEDSYHERVESFFEKEDIKDESSIKSLIEQCQLFYPALPESLHEKLPPVADIVTNQIITNWHEKDPKTATTFEARKESTATIHM